MTLRWQRMQQETNTKRNKMELPQQTPEQNQEQIDLGNKIIGDFFYMMNSKYKDAQIATAIAALQSIQEGLLKMISDNKGDEDVSNKKES